VDDFDVRAAVVLGRSGVFVWDTLAHPVPMAPAARLVADRRPIVAYSHGDWDHIWGTAAFPSTPDVVAHVACAERFRSELPEELSRRQHAEPGRWEAVRLVPPTRSFADPVEIDLGGVSVRLEALPGHTRDCAVAWIPEWGVLLAGDTVETPFPVVNDGAAVTAWVEELRRWAGEPGVQWVVPSHGRVGGVDVIRESIAYLEGLLRGAPPAVPADAPPFYLRTHRDNVLRVRAAHRG
jgi:glyoxylase-like metal-dependent hydrolase (beta-lactamase superfamily II)